MAKSRLVLNRRGFGEQVMASSGMEAELRRHADPIAAQVPGATVRAIRTTAAGGGARVRVRVEAENSFEHQTRAALVAAMRAVMGSATPR
jgi:hypothetical protein